MDMKDFFIQFDAKDPKVKKILDELYKNHDEQFETDVYKIYEDILNVAKPVTNRVAKSLIDYPLTNIFEIGRFIIIDIICPGVAKEQLTLTVERLEEKVFLRVKGIPWYGMKNSDLKGKKPERSDIEIGDAFDKRYDITPYNIDLNAITSEYKDGVLTVSLCKKPDEDRGKQQFTINIK